LKIEYWILNIRLSRVRLIGTVRPTCFALAFSLFALFGSFSVQAAEPSARGSFDAGLQAFAASNWPAASNAFLEAAAAAPSAKLDPAAAYYNAGLAAYAGGDLKAAADSFARASSGSDLRLQSQAYYNRGNALFHQVGGPGAAVAPAMPLTTMSTQELAGAEASVAEAIQMYENAIALDPQDLDAKANYELAVLKQQQIQQQKQQQQDQQKQDQQNQEQKQEEQQDQKQDQQQQQPQAQPQPQPENQPEENPQQEEEQIQADKPSEEMTPEEAAMMLDAMKAQEQSQRDRLHPFFGRPVPVEKDW
jgi:chemotaxis protein histidine kinase CheA